MSVSEVSKWFDVDRKTIYHAVASGTIPHRRVGKRVLFHRGALVAWLANQDRADVR